MKQNESSKRNPLSSELNEPPVVAAIRPIETAIIEIIPISPAITEPITRIFGKNWLIETRAPLAIIIQNHMPTPNMLPDIQDVAKQEIVKRMATTLFIFSQGFC